MSLSSSDRKGIFNEINITPLTDIFLVLLIIMMFIAPMFQAIDQDILLPSVNSGLAIEEDQVTVAVTRDSKFYVNSANVKEDKLAEELKAVLETAKDKKVIVKADSQTKTKEIMKVMRAAQEAGYERLTVAGEPLTGEQQAELKTKQEDIVKETGETK